MSSHHFVKEGQEPALILVDPFTLAEVGQMLEWSPFVVVLPGAIESMISAGIKADLIICYRDDFPEVQQLTGYQMPVNILSCYTNESALTIALDEIGPTGQSYIIIKIADADRAIGFVQPYVERLHLTIMDDKLKWSLITAATFTKWMTKDSLLQIKPTARYVVTGSEHKQTDNTIQILTDGFVSVHSDQVFWLGETF
jgi:hypothetical protein